MTRKAKKTSRIDAAPPGLMRYATTTKWMPDRDGDGVVDPWDCVPWDPDKQGILGDAYSAARRIVSPHVRRLQRTYTGARAGAERVMRRTRVASRRVGATIARYSPDVRQMRATAKFARAPVREARKTYRYVTGVGATRTYTREGRGWRSEVIMKDPTLLGDIKRAPSRFAEAERRAAERIPTLERIAEAGAPFRARHEREISAIRGAMAPIYRTEIGKAAHPYARGFVTGAYERVQKKPITTAATVAAFAVGGAALRGAGALAARVGVARRVSAIPKVGKPLVKLGPKAVMTGVGALWAGSMVQRVAVAETPEERGRVAGGIFMSEIATMAAAAKAPSAARSLYAAAPRVTTAEGYRGITVGTKHIIGIQKTKGVEAGVEQMRTTLRVGRTYTPVDYSRATQLTQTPTAEGVTLTAKKYTEFQIGKLRYAHEAAAVGKISGGYLLPGAKVGVLGRLKLPGPSVAPAAERLLLTTPSAQPPTPSRLYAEISKGYMKGYRHRLAGSAADIAWAELGTRKLMYGIRGPKQMRLIKSLDVMRPYKFHPTYPTGLPRAQDFAPKPVRMLSARLGFQKVAPTSRYIPEDILGVPSAPRAGKPSGVSKGMRDLAASLRRPSEPLRKAAGVTPPKPAVSPEPPAQQAHACYTSPGGGKVCPHDIGYTAPPMQRAAAPTPKVDTRPFAEPTMEFAEAFTLRAKPIVAETMLAKTYPKPSVRVAPEPGARRAPAPEGYTVSEQLAMTKPYTKALPTIKARARPKTKPLPVIAPFAARVPAAAPAVIPSPIPSVYPIPVPIPVPVPAPAPAPAPRPRPRPRPVPRPIPTPIPVPIPVPVPAPAPAPAPRPRPRPVPIPVVVPRPSKPVLVPPKKPPVIPLPWGGAGGIGGIAFAGPRRKAGKRVKHQMITLESFVGTSRTKKKGKTTPSMSIV